MQKTKIIATLGPACFDKNTIQQMCNKGLNVIRLNMSHITNISNLKKQITMIRRTAKQSQQSIAIMMDLSGPKIRTTLSNPTEPILIKKNQQYSLGFKNANILINANVSFFDINKKASIKIDDGAISFSIIKKTKNKLFVLANNNGQIHHHKGVNFPGIKLNIPAVTVADKQSLELAIDLDVDWIAQSFVRTSKDIYPIKRILSKHKTKIPVIAKIEKPEAIENLNTIIDQYDGILIARGDLGVEMNLSSLPKLQKQIINQCIYHKKPCIVATQMLESMIYSDSPTRAEVNDVANAIYDGVDAVMLSAETATGKYPIRAVDMMSKIAHHIESDLDISNFNRNIFDSTNQTIHDNYIAICHAAYSISTTLDIKVIAVLTDSGKTAIQMAQFRPNATIVAITPFPKICNQLSMIWGVVPIHRNQPKNINKLYHMINSTLIKRQLIKKGDNFLLSSGNLKNIKHSTNMLQIYQSN